MPRSSELFRAAQPNEKTPAHAAQSRAPTVWWILGGGGHSAELCCAFDLLSERTLESFKTARVVFFCPRGDMTSVRAAQRLVSQLAQRGQRAEFRALPSARNTRELYLLSAIKQCFAALFITLLLVTQHWRSPQRVFANGPGFAVPFLVAVKLYRLQLHAQRWLRRGVDTPQCTVLFAESVCRTRTLSATARLVRALRLCDAQILFSRALLRHCERSRIETLVFDPRDLISDGNYKSGF